VTRALMECTMQTKGKRYQNQETAET
jgi:hypothetical protein